MSDAAATSTDTREDLRRRWLAHAAAAFDLMFHPDHQTDLITFDQRESRACELGRDLSTWLIQQHANADEMARPPDDRQVTCPRCGRPARRRTEPGSPPPGRRLTGLSGEVELRRDQFTCTACRVVFFPLDRKLGLGAEGYSPAALRKAVRQAGKAPSFKEASEDLRELAGLPVSPSHLQRLSERIGREWAAARDADVAAFRGGRLSATRTQPARAATVMVDGGRYQARQETGEPGVSNPAWHEVKVACCQTLASTAHAVDPQPDPPAKFLDPVQAARLAAEIKSRGHAATGRAAADPPRRKRRKKRRRGPPKLVRTVVASTVDSETFGWQVATEVQRRGLDQAKAKGYICDGQKYNWAIFALHFVAWGFIPILDFLHLLGYLYGAAQGSFGKGTAAAWSAYERWLRWAWSGRTEELLAELRAASRRLGVPPPKCPEDDPRRVVAEALGYVENNRGRMDYPRYRRLGLPVSSAAVESTIKQINRRIKGTEKFWLEGGAEAILQLRAAHLSEDGRADDYWSRPRPSTRAVGQGSLRPSAA